MNEDLETPPRIKYPPIRISPIIRGKPHPHLITTQKNMMNVNGKIIYIYRPEEFANHKFNHQEAIRKFNLYGNKLLFSR